MVYEIAVSEFRRLLELSRKNYLNSSYLLTDVNVEDVRLGYYRVEMISHFGLVRQFIHVNYCPYINSDNLSFFTIDDYYNGESVFRASCFTRELWHVVPDPEDEPSPYVLLTAELCGYADKICCVECFPMPDGSADVLGESCFTNVDDVIDYLSYLGVTDWKAVTFYDCGESGDEIHLCLYYECDFATTDYPADWHWRM